MAHKEFNCPKCGSSQVRMETTATWSNQYQEWICDDDESTNDKFYCVDCGGEFKEPTITLSPD